MRCLADFQMPRSEKNPNSIWQRALAAGLKPHAVYARLASGDSLERALTPGRRYQKPGCNINPGSIRQRALAAGLHPRSVYHRMKKRGETLDEALSPGVRKPGPRKPLSVPSQWRALPEKIRSVLSSRVIYLRMKNKNITFREAVALGPSRKLLPVKWVRSRDHLVRRKLLHGMLGELGFEPEERDAIPAARMLGLLPPQLASAARAAGIDRSAAHYRIRNGMSWDEALTKPSKKPGPHSIRQQAMAAGLLPATVYARVGRGLSLSPEQALSSGHMKGRPDPNSLRQRAIARGLDPRVVQARVRRSGWSLERALSTPVRKKIQTAA